MRRAPTGLITGNRPPESVPSPFVAGCWSPPGAATLGGRCCLQCGHSCLLLVPHRHHLALGRGGWSVGEGGRASFLIRQRRTVTVIDSNSRSILANSEGPLGSSLLALCPKDNSERLVGPSYVPGAVSVHPTEYYPRTVHNNAMRSVLLPSPFT